MRLFKRDSEDRKADRAYDDNVNGRMKSLLSKDTKYEDPDTVEARLRNMNYGTSRK
ncbi:MAG: hypothetical protein R2823_04580 [Acidimicrobiia bacterium]